LNPDEAFDIVREHESDLVEKLIPPPTTMAEITVSIPPSNKIPKKLLEERLYFLKRRSLMDGGLAFVQHGGIVQGYIAQNELEYGLKELGKAYPETADVRVLGTPVDDSPDLDLSSFIDRAPISIPANAPIEVAVELFSKLGIRYLCVTQEGTGRLVGFVIKKRMLRYLDDLKHRDGP
jgi:chloride channel 3/4/5